MNSKFTFLLMLFLITSNGIEAQVRQMVLEPSGEVKEIKPRSKDPNKIYAKLKALEPKEAITAALDTTSLVALGETHNIAELNQFYLDLLSYQPFTDRINDIVLEEGNPLYQDLLDEYIYGGEVELTELRKVWKEGTHSIVNINEKSALEALLAKVRALNQKRTQDKKIRVLGGDSPIDWSAINSQRDWSIMLSRRDRYFGTTVWDQVLDNGRKALMIMGSAHFKRIDPNPPAINLVRMLDTRMLHIDQKVAVIHFYNNEIKDFEYVGPSLFNIKGTEIGDERNQPGNEDLLYEEQVDAVLYLGTPKSLNEVFDEPSDQEWMDEFNARSLRATGSEIRTFITDRIHTLLMTKGKRQARNWFEGVVKQGLDGFHYDERQFVMKGYDYIAKGEIENSLFLFKLGLQLYPDAWNMHDSLAEAYYKDGQDKLAIKHYEKSLDLNPENNNAVKMLSEIKAKR